ncbi:MAG: hypothetical protein RL112_1783 [Planctomycetota bacterium]|jgi:lipopolysaccharide export system permease protein
MSDRVLRPLGRLDRHVVGLFLASYATAFLVVVGLFLVLDMAGNLNDFLAPRDGRNAPVSAIARYYLLSLPFLYVQVAPFVTMVAGLFSVARLVRHQETVAAMAAGVSLRRMLAPLLVCGALCGAGSWSLREALAGRPLEAREALLHLLERKETERVVGNLWVRDGKGGVVHLDSLRPATGSPPRAVVEGFEAQLMNAREWTTVKADAAIWDSDRRTWTLVNGTRRAMHGQGGVEAVAFLDGIEFSPELALSYHRARAAPLELSFEQTLELSRRDPDNTDYQTLLQYQFTFPLANFVLLLVGLPLLLRHERGQGGRGVLLAALCALLYFCTDFVCRTLGLEGRLQPELAAWLPALLFGALGLSLFDGVRT